MTSDAKIGLILGLVFIFIIAFVINGLPNFDKNTSNNELTTNMVHSRTNAMGLGVRERQVSRRFIHPTEAVQNRSFRTPIAPAGPLTDNSDVRFQTELPKIAPIIERPPAAETRQIPAQRPPPPAVAKKADTDKIRSVEPTRPITHLVGDGDNLAVIAQRFYGPENGNKKANITRIFKANRRILNSPDEVYVGQKLIIPPLSSSGEDKDKIDGVFSAAMFEKVKSIGQKYLAADRGKPQRNGQYIVRESDSLWQIAAKKLGDGSRYTEIAKLNADIIDDQNCLVVGMRLKIPAR